VKELHSLCLDVKVLSEDQKEIELKRSRKTSLRPPAPSDQLKAKRRWWRSISHPGCRGPIDA